MNKKQIPVNLPIPSGSVCYLTGVAQAWWAHSVTVYNNGSEVASISNPKGSGGGVAMGAKTFSSAGGKFVVEVTQTEDGAKSTRDIDYRTGHTQLYDDSKSLGGVFLIGLEDDTSQDKDYNDVFVTLSWTAMKG